MNLLSFTSDIQSNNKSCQCYLKMHPESDLNEEPPKWSPFFCPWPPSVSSPHSGQSHLSTFKTFLAFHLSQNKRQKPFQKATYSPALSWLWPPVPWLPLSLSFSSSHTGLQVVPPTHQLCSCLSFAFGSLCVGTLFPRYLHYLLLHILQVFLKCHLMGNAFLIICGSILSILLTLIFLLSTYHHLKRYLSVFSYEKERSMRATLCSTL